MTFTIITYINEQTKHQILKLLTLSHQLSIPLIIKSESDINNDTVVGSSFNNNKLYLPNHETPLKGSMSNFLKVLYKVKQYAGDSELKYAQMDSWISFCMTSIEMPTELIVKLKTTDMNNDNTGILSLLQRNWKCTFSCLNQYLEYNTYFVGNTMSVADICISCALYQAKKYEIWDYNNVNDNSIYLIRWYKSIIHKDCFIHSVKKLICFSQEKHGTIHFGKTFSAKLVKTKSLYKRHRVRICDILSSSGIKNYSDQTVTVCGWTKTIRKTGRIVFLQVNDGSCWESLQCICESTTTDNFSDCKSSGGTGSSFQLRGVVIKSQGDQQHIELRVSHVQLLGAVYGGDSQGKTIGGFTYPLSKKNHTLEHMRQNAHLRPRSGIHGAVMRLRHSMAFATHEFFHQRGFLYIHTPILTCVDCEGAGEQFAVTTLLGGDPLLKDVKLPIYSEEILEKDTDEGEPLSKQELKRRAKKTVKFTKKGVNINKIEESNKVLGAIDYTNDFFCQRANLTVSGQLNVETHACALSDVYTFGPTFRAENSHTVRHLSEFWMVEPEIAFADLNDSIHLAEDYITYCINYTLTHCKKDLNFLQGKTPSNEKGLKEKLQTLVKNPFARLTYTEAIQLLEKAYTESQVEFEIKPSWGIDLATEHERYLCETIFLKPVILTNYPMDIKAFYMKLDDNDSCQKTVASFDILFPKIGEIIGGSQREHRKDILTQRCIDTGLNPEHLSWYIDLRKYGSVPHAGFGMGFERLILFISGLDNIRDVIPFPRWQGNAQF